MWLLPRFTTATAAMTATMLLVLLAVGQLEVGVSTVSFTTTGHWDESKAHPKNCDRFMCTPKNKTFIPDDPNFIYYDPATACDLLIKKGINLITFYGDSFVRQMYAGMLIALNGDYQYGSLADNSKSPTCEYRKQFYEKKCGVFQLNHFGWSCGKKILLDPTLTGMDGVGSCMPKKGALQILSFGNHKLGTPRYGVNNATAYSKFFSETLCLDALKHKSEITGSFEQPCSMWWVSTHFRRIGWFPDEKEEIIKDYNLGMRHFFDSGSCGAFNYVDVYNMTKALVTEDPVDSEQMTYDNVHWGLEVNLIKAQILLNAILRSDYQA